MPGYVEAGISGEKLETRPQLQRLLTDAKAGLFDVIVVVSSSRLARDEYVHAFIKRALREAGSKSSTWSTRPSQNHVPPTLWTRMTTACQPESWRYLTNTKTGDASASPLPGCGRWRSVVTGAEANRHLGSD